MTLALTIPDKDPQWIEQFGAGLHAAAAEFGVVLIGGDTTSGASIVATVAMSGEIEPGKALLRSGAQVGETIFVSGTLGDAAAGLQLLSRQERDDFLNARFLRPTARIPLGQELLGRASAVIDISDGLIGDLKKLLVASGVGAQIDVELLPLSDVLRQRFNVDEQRNFALTGGDDYELCFAASLDAVQGVAGITPIGVVTQGDDLVCRLGGDIVEYDDSGYRHFR
jgi:thiamine-monophosphate kinase